MKTESNASQTPVGLAQLRYALIAIPGRLAAISRERAATRPSPDAWSANEELGHLIDSAANNHQRIVRAQLEDNPAMRGYAQQAWVDLHGYKRREWRELIELWRALNQQLLAAAEAVPESARSRTCTIAGSEPLTIEFVFEDYLEHMLHHLQHIGIDVADLRSGAVAAD